MHHNPSYSCTRLNVKHMGDDGDGSSDDLDSIDTSDDEMTVIMDKDTKPLSPGGVPSDEEGGTIQRGHSKKSYTFTDEQYTIASPVVLGFSLEDKSWHEFAVSGTRDITWDDSAFDTLVLPDEHKRHVKALVASHGKGPDNADDVIKGQYLRQSRVTLSGYTRQRTRYCGSTAWTAWSGENPHS